MPDNPTTRRLDQILASVDNMEELREYLSAPGTISPNSTFIAYFKSLPKVSRLGPAELYRRANMDRSYCYHIWGGTKTPSRDKIILLCLAAGLDINETRRSLEAGQQASLYSRSQRDAVIIFAIQNGLTVNETNDLLDEIGVEILE